MALGRDARIAVLDRAPLPADGDRGDPRAYALSAASRNVLEALGAWHEIAADAQPVTAIEITDSPLEAGIRPVLLTYDNHVAETGEPASHIVPNAAVLRALVGAVTRTPGIDVLAPASFAGLEPEVGGLRVGLGDGRRLTAALVVAADGRRSPVREAAGIKVVGWPYAQTGIVTTLAHERPHHGVAVQHFLPAGPFAILPLPGNRSCITWSEDAGEATRILALDDAGFLAEVDRRFGGRLGEIELAGPRRSWPLDMHLARAFVAPRLALVGDAAHGVHPIAGQGLNLALRDVAALAECVVDVMRLGLDAGDAMALERYERWRRFDSTLSAATFDALNRLFSNDVGLLRSAREAGLGLVDRLPFLKRLLVAEAAGLSGELPRLVRGHPI
jgi:2-octaprenyl-6-methoxyphenol hydroxylase